MVKINNKNAKKIKTDWIKRKERTDKAVAVLEDFFLEWQDAHPDVTLVWYADNFPPCLKVFVTFVGINRVTDNHLTKLTDLATYICNNGFPHCKKEYQGNEVEYRFMIPFHKGEGGRSAKSKRKSY